MGLFTSIASGGGAVVKGVGTATLLYAVAGLVALVAVCFALLAAFFGLVPQVGEIWAALIIAAVLLLVALLFALVAAAQIRRAKRRAASFAAMAPIATMAGPLAFGAVKRAPAVAALALLGIGFLAARRRS